MITAVEAAINEAMIRKKKNTLPMERFPTCEKRIYDKLIFTLVQQKKKKGIAQKNSNFDVKFRGIISHLCALLSSKSPVTFYQGLGH